MIDLFRAFLKTVADLPEFRRSLIFELKLKLAFEIGVSVHHRSSKNL